MSKPAINPQKTVAGIAVDPQTLERVIPESKRPDGTVRKQKRIRPGYTPQEDVRRFRGTKQAQMDVNVLPKGHIIGWAPPPSTAGPVSATKPMSKSAKKNAKRREKKAEKQEAPENWDDEDEEGEGSNAKGSGDGDNTVKTGASPRHTPEQPNWAVAPAPDPTRAPTTMSTAKSTPTADDLASDLEKMSVQ